MGQEQTVADHG